jgi:hypothetical protein
VTTIARAFADATGIPALLRTWPGRFIMLFLAVQLLLPLRYYIRHRDLHDERFAWRMFSPMRMAHCKVNLAIDGVPRDPYGEFHEAWVKIAERGRFVVVEAMAAKLCTKYAGKPIEMSLDCEYLDHSVETYGGGFNMCNVPEL